MRRSCNVTDQPLSVALRARFTNLPSEFFCALAVCFRQMTAGEGDVSRRILLGLVDSPNLDRVHLKFVGEFVDRRFESKRAERFAGSAHPCIRDRIEIDDLLSDI